MNSQYEKDIIACYKSIWDIYSNIPTVELILEEYKELKRSDVANFAIDFYNDIGCYDESERIKNTGLSNIDYDNVGFEEDSCATDIDIVLEEAGYTFYRENEIVNKSQIYLFGKEWW